MTTACKKLLQCRRQLQATQETLNWIMRNGEGAACIRNTLTITLENIGYTLEATEPKKGAK